jgi:uncharacterized pyridoxal phosphate-dependent enzyme
LRGDQLLRKEEDSMTNTYEALGMRPVINAAATLTKLGGSIMPPEVVAAMRAAADSYIDLFELQEKVGARIAELTHNEAAFISSGAAAGIAVTVCACMIGEDRSRAFAFPSLEGIEKTEVVVFKAQRNGYDYAITQTGAHVIEAESSTASFEAALSERTACVVWFAGDPFAIPGVPLEAVIEIAHKRGVPVIVDAAAQVPYVANLWHFTRDLGADIAIFSGGKGLRGPQSSGLVLGKRAIIEGCQANGAPNQGFGRPMKVGKEEFAGILAAVEWTLKQDEAELLMGYEQTVANWIEDLSGIPGVQVERSYPSEAGQPYPRAFVHLSEPSGWKPEELVSAMWEGTPRIAVLIPNGAPDVVALNPQTLQPGDDQIVLERLRELLTSRP